jgi:vacuolar-type H+-ATPase subunit F/Vma7
MDAEVAVIGEETRVRAYALAGASVRPADDAAAVRAAWAALGPHVRLVILTEAAARALPAATAAGERLVAVMR